MPIDSVTDLVQVLRRYPLLEASQRDELDGVLQARFTCPRTLSKELMMRGWLTPYQVNLVLQGRGPELMLGSYVLIERLNESPMGQMFKARHQHMKRLVGLLVVRAELLADPGAVERFYQEVQMVSPLSHPHLLTAYDAGPIGLTHFFAMEHVEGVTLDRWVQQVGPLDVDQACSYIRQTALGLQHAFERGLLHQDLEPANLLLAQTKAGTSRARGEFESEPGALDPGSIKVRNLGLSLIRGQRNARAPGAEDGGIVLADFLAPERPDATTLGDVRSEVYSLGCIFFYLLTGQTPFVGDTPEEKHQRHWHDAPPTIESLRLEVPHDVTALVRRMMAKDPAARPQTPQEVADALSAWADPSTCSRPTETVAEHQSANGAPAGPGWLQRKEDRSKRQWRWLVAGGGGVLALASILFAVLLLTSGKKQPTEDARVPADLTYPVEAAAAWQDTHIDLPASGKVVLSTKGAWRSGPGAEECGGEGESAAAGNRGIVPDAKLMCLLVRIGENPVPQVVPMHKAADLRGPGRLFVQANLRDLRDAKGSLTLSVSGGKENPSDVPIWQYGSGDLDDARWSVRNFVSLVYSAKDNRYQGDYTKFPSPPLNYLHIGPAAQGHPGPNKTTSAIRRWTSPGDGVISISGELSHGKPDGDGVRAWVVSSRLGLQKQWIAHNNLKVKTDLPRIAVQKGDTIEVGVDSRGNEANDYFEWSPVLRITGGTTLTPPR